MRQLPLALRWRPAHQLDDFIFAEASTRGLLLQAIANKSPIFLSGAKGSGKSTLLEALAKHIGAQFSPIALDEGDAASRIANAEHALFDHLEALPASAEAALFARFNRCHDQREVFLVASALGVEQLQISLPDLRSRLAQCLQISLPLLQDEAARREVLRTQAQSFGLSLNDALLAFLDVHVARDLPALADTLAYLHQESLSRSKALTLAQARRALKARAAASALLNQP
jgi:DnaA-homolog protein